jgi:GT2 family glycosyltransferase
MSNWELTRRSLLSINESGANGTHVYIIDNSSNDGSYERLSELVSKRSIKDTTLLRAPTNLGYAGGNNLGYEQLGPSVEYFVLMNNDFVIVPGALGRLIEFLDKDQSIGAIQGKIVSLDGKVASYGHQMNELLEGITVRRRLVPDVVYTSGCFSAYRREAIRHIEHNGNLFIPALFAYGDDDYLALRLWKAGYRSVCVDVLTGYHESLGSFQGKMAFQFYLRERAWLALLTASNSRYRIFEILTAGRLAVIGLIRALINRDPKELYCGIRASIDGIRIGRMILRERGQIDIYAAPVRPAGLMQVLFARFSGETGKLVLRRHRARLPGITPG